MIVGLLSCCESLEGLHELPMETVVVSVVIDKEIDKRKKSEIYPQGYACYTLLHVVFYVWRPLAKRSITRLHDYERAFR